MLTYAVPLWDMSNGQELHQLAELGLALLLSSLIGWERAARQNPGRHGPDTQLTARPPAKRGRHGTATGR